MPTLDAAQLKMGSSSVSTAYLGATKVWPKWTPANITTVMWYDATDASTITTSGSEVTQVLDKSGNGYTLTRKSGQAGPTTGTRTLNGRNVFEWNANCGLENLSFTHNQATTPLNLAMVLRMDSPEPIQYFMWAMRPSVTAGERLMLRYGSGWQVLGGSMGGVNQTMGGGAASFDQPYLICPRLNAADSRWRNNGSQVNTGNIGTNAASIFMLGTNEQANFDLDGYIAEVVGFSSINDIITVEGYLAWKWGLQGNLPAVHQYKNFPP